jgi:methyl-accepting chemotaxis protein
MPEVPEVGGIAVVGILVLMILKIVFDFVQNRRGGGGDKLSKLEKQMSEVVSQARATQERESRDVLVQEVTSNFKEVVSEFTTHMDTRNEQFSSHLDAQNELLKQLARSSESQNKAIVQIANKVDELEAKMDKERATA